MSKRKLLLEKVEGRNDNGMCQNSCTLSLTDCMVGSDGLSEGNACMG